LELKPDGRPSLVFWARRVQVRKWANRRWLVGHRRRGHYPAYSWKP